MDLLWSNYEHIASLFKPDFELLGAWGCRFAAPRQKLLCRPSVPLGRFRHGSEAKLGHRLLADAHPTLAK
jgi:hypothetical protein